MELISIISFIDSEKAFDSIDRDSLWKIMRHYGIPNKYISIVKTSYYEGMTCRVLHGGMVAYFCHHLSDNNVDLSDIYVDLSDLYVDLSLIPSVEK